MRRFLIVLLLCISVCLLIAEDSNMIVAVDDFLLTVPQWWSAVRPGNPNLLILTAPDAADGFQSNVNVLTETVPAGMTVAEYLDAAQTAIAAVLPDFEVIERGGFYHIYRVHSTDGRLIIQVQSVYIRSDTAYVVTCTADADSFDSIEPTFISLINSIRFID